MPRSLPRATPEEIWDALQKLKTGSASKVVAETTGRTKAVVDSWKKKYHAFGSLNELRTHLRPEDGRYIRIMKALFQEKWNKHSTGFDWERTDIPRLAKALQFEEPKNLGDNIYSIRHGREDLPLEIRELAPAGKFWLLLPNGKSAYRFVLADRAFLDPDPAKKPIKIPDSTPQIVARYAKKDEQAVLARIRYCRLVDIFLGLASYQLQSHMRTTIAHFNGAQTELDEIYVGVDSRGTQFVIPIQAKGDDERIGAVQVVTDHFTCLEKFPNMIGRTLVAKTVAVEHDSVFGEIFTIALIEASVDALYNVQKLKEEHFQLLPSALISASDLDGYRLRYSPGAFA